MLDLFSLQALFLMKALLFLFNLSANSRNRLRVKTWVIGFGE